MDKAEGNALRLIVCNVDNRAEHAYIGDLRLQRYPHTSQVIHFIHLDFHRLCPNRPFVDGLEAKVAAGYAHDRRANLGL